MTDVSVQTDDILINGVPLHEFIKNNSNDLENNESVWDFLNDKNSGTDREDGDDLDDDVRNHNEICYSVIESNKVVCPPLSETDIEEMRESVLYCIEQNIINNPLSFSDPAFHVKLENSIYEIIDDTFSYGSYGLLIKNDVFMVTDDMENSIEEIITSCLD